MSPQSTHPLVTHDLAELDALLRDVDPLERAEVVLQGLALSLVLLTYGTLGAFVSTSTSSSDGDFVVTDRDYVGSVLDAVALMVAAFPFWLLAGVLVAVTARWTHRESAALMVLVPGCTVLLSGLPPLGYALVGEIGVHAGAVIALVVALGGGSTVVNVLVRRALRRSRGVAATS